MYNNKFLFGLIIFFYSIASAKVDSLPTLSSTLNSLAYYNSLISSSVPQVAKPIITPSPVPVPKPTPIPAHTGQMIVREDFFKDIVGTTESQFRGTYGWKKDSDNDWGILSNPPQDLNSWIKQYPTRAAIFQGEFKMYTPPDLMPHLKKLTNEPYFRIIIHDPKVPQQTDIRYLQADPNLKYANFQLASTFWGPLEGGMYRWQNSLEEMLGRPVQGEEASISAAPATIFRKYFMKPVYLLENLGKNLRIDQGRYGPRINATNYTPHTSDIDKIGIGIHKNIVVSSGYGIGSSGPDARPGKTDSQEKLPIYIQNDKIDISKTQIVHQIFTAAYDLSRARSDLPVGRINLNEFNNITNTAKKILAGMYKGALGAPFITNSPVLYLTLLGGGAFLNSPEWIANAITPHDDLIKNGGLQVTLIYRPDPRKNPVRGVNPDFDFLKEMFKMSDKINGSNISNNQNFWDALDDYLNAAYETNDINKQAQAAVKLNAIINNSLPNYAPKIMQESTWTQPSTSNSAKPTAPKPIEAQELEFIMDLTDRKTGQKTGGLYWKKIGTDAVLINQQNDNSYTYVAPGFPSEELKPGLYYWKSQGLDKTKIGDHKNVTVKDSQGNIYEYKGGKNGQYVMTQPHIPGAAASASGFELIMNLTDKNGNKTGELGWESLGNDKVLVNRDPSGSTIKYVAPGYPGEALPQGLYYWKSQGLDKKTVGNHKNVVIKDIQGNRYEFKGGKSGKYVKI